jgi:hypothetical protein
MSKTRDVTPDIGKEGATPREEVPPSERDTVELDRGGGSRKTPRPRTPQSGRPGVLPW